MTIQDKTRTTKQGLRDLNFYGSRKKLATEATAEVTSAESLAPIIADAVPTTTAPQVVLDPMAAST